MGTNTWAHVPEHKPSTDLGYIFWLLVHANLQTVILSLLLLPILVTLE